MIGFVPPLQPSSFYYERSVEDEESFPKLWMSLKRLISFLQRRSNRKQTASLSLKPLDNINKPKVIPELAISSSEVMNCESPLCDAVQGKVKEEYIKSSSNSNQGVPIQFPLQRIGGLFKRCFWNSSNYMSFVEYEANLHSKNCEGKELERLRPCQNLRRSKSAGCLASLSIIDGNLQLPQHDCVVSRQRQPKLQENDRLHYEEQHVRAIQYKRILELSERKSRSISLDGLKQLTKCNCLCGHNAGILKGCEQNYFEKTLQLKNDRYHALELKSQHTTEASCFVANSCRGNPARPVTTNNSLANRKSLSAIPWFSGHGTFLKSKWHK